MHWRIIHYPPRNAPSRSHVVRAASREAAKRKLAAVLGVPDWTLR
ncbi:MAG: hypothetical protein OXH79_18515 [Boseongicola sp.]|nr:hypothetical protein [Boseongicola sp.]